MKIHEYQGKEILLEIWVTVPRVSHVYLLMKRSKLLKHWAVQVWVVKAQIHAGGRGKGGGVKVAKSLNKFYVNTQTLSWVCNW